MKLLEFLGMLILLSACGILFAVLLKLQPILIRIMEQATLGSTLLQLL